VILHIVAILIDEREMHAPLERQVIAPVVPVKPERSDHLWRQRIPELEISRIELTSLATPGVVQMPSIVTTSMTYSTILRRRKAWTDTIETGSARTR
jgi:hypothetical protein